MAKSQGRSGKAHAQFPNARRVNGFYIVPSQHAEVRVIGYDTADGPEHALYDPRVDRKSPSFVKESDAAFVRLCIVLREFGNIQPVKLRRDGPHFDVSEGRERWRAFRDVINPAHVRAGEEEQAVLVLVERAEGGDDRWFARRNLGANVSVPEDPVTQAIKVQRAQAAGCSDEEIAVCTGVHRTTWERWLKLLDCSADVQDAVRAGLPIGAALTLAELPRKEQLEALEQFEADGIRPSVARIKAVVKAKREPGAEPLVARPPARFVKALLDVEADVPTREVKAAEAFLLGVRWCTARTVRGDVSELSSMLQLFGLELPR